MPGPQLGVSVAVHNWSAAEAALSRAQRAMFPITLVFKTSKHRNAVHKATLSFSKEMSIYTRESQLRRSYLWP